MQSYDLLFDVLFNMCSKLLSLLVYTNCQLVHQMLYEIKIPEVKTGRGSDVL